MTEPMAYRETGVIRRICGGGHYGSIESGSLRDIYFHHSRVCSGDPEEGAEVRFTRGWRAIEIEVL